MTAVISQKTTLLLKKHHTKQIIEWFYSCFSDKMLIPLWYSGLFNFERTLRVPNLHPNWVPCGLNKSGLVILNCLSSLVEYTFTFFYGDIKLTLKLNPFGGVLEDILVVFPQTERVWRHGLEGRTCRAVFFYFIFYINCLFQIPLRFSCEIIMFIHIFFIHCSFQIQPKWTCLDRGKYRFNLN